MPQTSSLTVADESPNTTGIRVLRLRISLNSVELSGKAVLPEDCNAFVLIAPDGLRDANDPNPALVSGLLEKGIGIVSVNLLSSYEKSFSCHLLQDIPKLADRLAIVMSLVGTSITRPEPRVGLFGSGHGAAVALAATPLRRAEVQAAVVYNLKPRCECYIGEANLPPTLFILTADDDKKMRESVHAMDVFGSIEKNLRIIRDPLESKDAAVHTAQMAGLATDWFSRHFEML